MASLPPRYPPPLPPRIGLTRIGPILRLFGVGRPAFVAGIKAGTFPPPLITARKPGSAALWGCAKVWAVIEGQDWRDVNSAMAHDPDDHRCAPRESARKRTFMGRPANVRFVP